MYTASKEALVDTKTFMEEGDYASAADIVANSWSNYETILKPIEDELMDLWNVCSLDCILEFEF